MPLSTGQDIAIPSGVPPEMIIPAVDNFSAANANNLTVAGSNTDADDLEGFVGPVAPDPEINIADGNTDITDESPQITGADGVSIGGGGSGAVGSSGVSTGGDGGGLSAVLVAVAAVLVLGWLTTS